MLHGYKGYLISFEGIDGSGKSTLARNLESTLAQKGIITLLTKEPGGTELGKSLRQILQTQSTPVCDQAEYLLFAADRAQHFKSLIIPALQDGTVVIADRLADSSLAYQGYGRGVDKAMINHVNKWVMQDVVPNLTIYLSIDPAVALDRVRQRNEQLTAFEQQKYEFWQRVTQGYEEIFAARNNVVTLDGTLSQQTLCQLAVQEVLTRLG